MPGNVSIIEALGQPTIPADADFAMCFIGRTSNNPLGSGPGPVSGAYSNPAALAAAWGLGDAVDCACQAITVTQGNPAPPPVAIYQTPATTPGVHGALTTSGITGDAVVTITSGTTPLGTYQPVGRVVVGGVVGVAGIVIEFSPDGGRTWLPSQQLGTANTLKMQIGGLDTGIQYDFALDPIEGSTDVTDGALYGGAGTLDGLTLILDVNDAGPATLNLNGGTNTANQAALLAAIEAQWPAIDASVSATHLLLTLTTGGSIVIGAGTANAALGLTADTYEATLVEDDTWSEAKTTPPIWAIGDLYTAGPPATGAFPAIAQASASFAIVVITEPIVTGNIPTLTTALNYLATFGKRPSLLCRFRDPTPGETDAQYVAAVETFRASNNDNRIMLVAGSGWLTDALRGYRYFRSGLPALVARLQSMSVIPGKLGERMAQHPGYVARGPLEGFTLVDDDGNPISQAHDELVTGGLDGPLAGAGGVCTFYYQRRDTLRGTYVSDAQVMYPPLSQILTWMDRRVANGLESIAEALAWTEIQGANIYDPTTLELDADIVDALQTKIAQAIRSRYGREFQNPDDPNLVTITPTVTVSGSRVSISGTVNWRPFGYTWDIALTFSATR